MIINQQNLNSLFTGYNAAYKRGFEGAASHWNAVAMKVTSMTEKEIYTWLAQLPGFREWIGDRVIKGLATKGFEVTNRDFESTIAVPRNKIEDDLYGVYTPMIEEIGRAAASHPDQLVFELLGKGFTERCHDGQYFFDTDHPMSNAEGEAISVANTDGGSGEPWYLLDTSRAIRPLIYQERRPYHLVRKDDERDDNVFFRKEYIYGVDARSAAGFGMWQLAWGSKQQLSSTNYSVGRAAMQKLKGEDGRPLGVRPTVLIVGPSNEQSALELINSATLSAGESNPWHRSVEVIVTPWAS
jgi:phage major head subunit gpT-like protein